MAENVEKEEVNKSSLPKAKKPKNKKKSNTEVATKEKDTKVKNEETKLKKEQPEKKQKKEIEKKEITKKKKNKDKEENEEEIQEAIGKEIKENKKIPQEELKKMYKQVFQNVCIAIAVMIYLDFLILGFINIKDEIFITDLKVFGLTLLAVAIAIFEYAYKKDSGMLALYGIETLLLSCVTVASIYIYLMWNGKFIYITALLAYIFSIYYVAKSIVIYNKMKKQYFLDKMKDIIKK